VGAVAEAVAVVGVSVGLLEGDLLVVLATAAVDAVDGE